MRVVRPSPILRDASRVLLPIREEVIVIGALAVQIALDGHDVALPATVDIDAGTTVDAAAEVVSHLEDAGLRRSELPHERGFTWVGEGVKVQLIRPFHPFPKPPADGLPVNTMLPSLESHRWLIAFEEDPDRGLFWAAPPAALVALKEMAFGRTRPSGEPVDRDFSDAALLLDNEIERIAEETAGDSQLRGRVIQAATRLRDEPDALEAAIRQLVADGQEPNPRVAETMVRRAVRLALAELGAAADAGRGDD